MNDIRHTSRLVEHILENNCQARNSDTYLYLKVIEHQANEKGINIRLVALPVFLLNSAKWGFAHFETVRRARQKLQARRPDLQSTAEVAAVKDIKEQEFREFAKE